MTNGSTTDAKRGTGESNHIGQAANGDAVATTVAMAIAEATDRDPADLTPLGTVLDCEALDTLVTSAETSVSVSFVYEGHRVYVSGDGDVDIDEVEDGAGNF